MIAEPWGDLRGQGRLVAVSDHLLRAFWNATLRPTALRLDNAWRDFAHESFVDNSNEALAAFMVSIDIE